MKHFFTQKISLACLSLTALLYHPGAHAVEKRPNLIFVVLDDLDWLQTGPYLKELMPFLSQKTESEGVRIDAAHSAAICCEARAAILTGLYAHNNGVFTNGGIWGGYEAFREPKDSEGLVRRDQEGRAIDNEERTFAKALQDSGYLTGIFGKYLNGFERKNGKLPELPQGWSQGSVYIDPNLRSYLGYGYELLNWSATQMQAESFGYRPQDYATDVLTEKALAFLQEPTEAPKFLYLSYTAPHLPLPPAPRHVLSSLQWANTAPRSPNTFQDGDDAWLDKPQWLQDSKDARTRPELKAWMRHDWNNRLGSLLAVDEGLARLWSELERLGQADRSLVIVTSDNGYNNGAHGLIHKMAPYEETLRVPLYVFGGKDIELKRGLQTQAWTSHVDYFPSFLEAAGVPLPEGLDGQSLWPLWKGRTEPLRSELLFSYQGGEAANGREIPLDAIDARLFGGLKAFMSDVPTHLGLKKIFALGPELRSFKLIGWPQKDQALFKQNAWQGMEWELYDLDRDPFELNNLSYHKPEACRALQEIMQESLEKLFVCEGQACQPKLALAREAEVSAVRNCEAP